MNKNISNMSDSEFDSMDESELIESLQNSEETPRYDVFIRTWYIYDDNENIIPGPGEKTYICDGQGLTRSEAIAICKQWNDEHEPGELLLNAEFELE